MSLIGCTVEYELSNGEVRRAIIEDIVFNESLNKEAYVCISPYGYIFELTLDELCLV